MVRHRALQTNVFAALVLGGAACCAALIAHVGIDVAGDFVLAHDAYDGLDHRSRSEVFVVALTLALGAFRNVVWRALDEARTGRPAPRPSFDDVFGRSPWRFLLAVVALTLPALMTMEFVDLCADGGRLDDPADLLGGSALLGLSITIPVAALVACTVRSIAQLIMNSHHALVAAFGRLIALLARAYRRSAERSAEPGGGLQLRQRSILARRSGKRGPPQRAS
jgi:hypothetical protein